MGTAVVTGAGRGIGAAIARSLAASGRRVVKLDLTAGHDVTVCDVTDAAAVADVAAELGTVDVVVNNAATWRFAALEDTEPDDLLDVLRVNLIGALNTIRAFGRGMLERGDGAIVNVASVAAAHPNPGVGGYAASKAALVALTQQVAVEWGPRGVRCNAVAPGLVATPGTADVYGDETIRRARERAVPSGRLGDPEDVAAAVAFLSSPQASYINGETLTVDGGLSRALMASLPRPEPSTTEGTER